MNHQFEGKPGNGMTFCDCCGCGYSASQVDFHAIEIKSRDCSICDGCWPLRSVDWLPGMWDDSDISGGETDQ